eukprot:m.175061 g.175061  ORF g.175061 m.175061 type:complete len:52 (+) comp16766_c2_seq9:565-720(+)
MNHRSCKQRKALRSSAASVWTTQGKLSSSLKMAVWIRFFSQDGCYPDCYTS